MIDTPQILLLISLGLYCLELGLFFIIKHLFDAKPGPFDLFIEQMGHMMKETPKEYLAAYTVLYLFMLLFAKVWLWLYTLLITLQLMSVSFNVYVLKEVSRK